MRLVPFAIATLLAGCASLPKCPREGGPAWRAVETEHFVVYSEAGGDTPEELARDLEFVRGAVAHFLLPGWDGPPGQIPVVALAAERHYQEYSRATPPARTPRCSISR